ncbi:MAG: hypothetical protein ACD_46C00725G0005 [uncultured bacterium]|nr:MAG: hypothetical protein ACD_46C00725G0005 [uncultured bacterium]
MKNLKLFYFFQNKKIALLDITIFFRQLSAMTTAAIPIIKTFDILEKSQEKNTLRILIYSIKRELFAGKNLSEALMNHPNFFNSFTCHLIKIGESTGKIDTILQSLAQYYESKLILKKKIHQAIFYPCIILLAAFLITFAMLFFVIPKFAELFQDMPNKLPFITLIIFKISSFIRDYAGLMLTAFICLLTSFFFIPSQKLWLFLMPLFTKLPIIQQFLFKVSLTFFARHLSLTFSSGLPITEALSLTAKAVGNPYLSDIIYKIRTKIVSGMTLHHAMSMHHELPPLLIQLAQVGEESGKLEQMLDKFVYFNETEIQTIISYLSNLLEPLIMLVLGVLIGGLVIGMYLPIFKLGNTF